MTKAIMLKHLNSLRPADEEAEELLRGIRHGRLVEVQIRRPRNLQHHRLFFALCTRVWEQLDRDICPTVENFVTVLKLGVGHCDLHQDFLTGKIHKVPRSIAFAAMDQTQFDEFFGRCCDWIAENVLEGITERELREEVELMIGARA